MHTTSRLSLSALAVLALAGLLLVPSSALKADDAQTPAGTWVVSAEMMPGIHVPSLHTYHPDGTITSSDVLAFGGLPGVPIRMTPLHGVWERTGPSAFATTNLTLVYDAASSVVIGFGRARATMSLDKGADHGTGTATVEFLPCPSPFSCPDPQATDALWTSFPGVPPSLQVTAERLRNVR